MSVMSTHHDACKHGANLKKLSVGEDRAGLSIVPVVPWEGASAASPPPPMNCHFYHAVLTFANDYKCRQLFGRRKVHPERVNPGYVYKKRAPGLRWYGPSEWLIRPWERITQSEGSVSTGSRGKSPW